MNKNTIIGIALIGLILLGFSFYNTRQFKEQQEIKRVQDSIAAVRAFEYAKELAEQKSDSLSALALGGAASESGDTVKGVYSSTYSNDLLESAHNSPAQFYTLENDKVVIKYTSKGGQPLTVRVKDYYTHDSLDLYLMKEDASSFGIQMYTSQMINTKDFSFQSVEHTDSTLVMRLFFGENSYIEHNYKLSAGSYLVDFNFKLVGMGGVIPKNAAQFDMVWNMDIPRLERGYENEKNYSTIVYKYPDESSVENLGLRKDSAEESLKTKISWFAFQQQFFSAILVADNSFSQGNLSYKFFKEGDPSNNLMACHADVQVQYDMTQDVTIPFKFYFGPNLFNTLKSYDYGFEKIVPLGWGIIGWINRFVIIPIFDLFNGFISNYGIIILLLTLLIKLVISPLTLKSYMSSAKMSVLRPEIQKINEKYPKQEDAMKKQQEVMELYRKGGVNMFGGCLPMLLQFPILIAMFRFFPASFELRQQSFLWATDLSAYDSILDLPFKIPLYGDHVSLFAILMAVSMFFYSKMTASQMDSTPQMAGMKFMTVYFMPIFMLVLCNNFSSGLSYYYMLSNLITIGQTFVIKKYFIDEEKILARIKENSSKSATKPKSKFQQRLEAAAKAQQEAAKKQKRR